MTDYCHKCKKRTETLYLPLSSGHIGNCCAVCRAARKGRPYATRQEYLNQAPIATRPEGEEETKAI